MTYITVSDVRNACGIPSSLASDSAIEHSISIVEPLTERAMNTKFEPTQRIDYLDGTGVGYFYTDKNPVLRVDALKSDDESLDVSSLNVYHSSGKVAVGVDSSTTNFIEKQKSIIVKYRYGLLDRDEGTQTTTDGSVSAGTSVTVTVDDESGFSSGDWVEISGMDGNREVAKITSISGSDITVDRLNLSHEDESTFIKLQIPSFIKRFMELEASIYVGLNAIGATYTFNASYSLADLQVSKGVPYTHWKESLQKAIKEREGLRSMIKPRPKIMVG